MHIMNLLSLSSFAARELPDEEGTERITLSSFKLVYPICQRTSR